MPEYIERFLPEERVWLEKIIKDFHFSLSNTRKFLIYIYEISKREEIVVLKIIEKLNTQDILQNNSIQGKHKGEKLIEALYKMRFPEAAGDTASQSIQVCSMTGAYSPDGSEVADVGYKPSIIFIENEIKDLEYTKTILNNFPDVEAEYIDNIAVLIKANRHKIYDKKNQPLVLAKQRGAFFEKCPGTKEHICCNYYTLNIAVGCPFDCTYCFLQSYTNNPFYTIYVNMDDMLLELKQKLPKDRTVRIGTGEFTDSLALEQISGFAKKYVPKILSENPNVVLELKTKSADISWLNGIGFQDRLVIAWSLNPESIVSLEEHYSASLEQRLSAAKKTIEQGYKIAFHFDPIIYDSAWEGKYQSVVEKLKTNIDPKKISWLSLGILRFTPSLKPIVEQKFPGSKIIYGEFFPGADKKMRYPEAVRVKIYNKMLQFLQEWDRDIPVYFCMESADIWKKVLGGLPKQANKLNHLFS